MPFDSTNYQPDEVLGLLTDARNWLSDPAHWCSHGWGTKNEDGSLRNLCARGAVLWDGSNVKYTPARTEADKILASVLPGEWSGAPLLRSQWARMGWRLQQSSMDYPR